MIFWIWLAWGDIAERMLVTTISNLLLQCLRLATRRFLLLFTFALIQWSELAVTQAAFAL